ncbi:GNAT family N-acetyltransferase [Sedimentibacter sp. MB31-C6]|uniref:GNAT family N-acetyltransferase n=1 Tax=Sedimentibacter sp. MB31-C6 TaxID=3109366 RepID=UPI002DDCFFB6|nr:GNAT family N-acetyltransferase [Sedimentibacter sp. MB36-C1]WSI03279.1 GNAT family N-acetyltransferase [Sedimentibacter sp. MB36-C1]
MDFKYEENRIYLESSDGKCIAEITFPSISKNEVNINHTYVDTSLRGQGVANKLITALVNELKKTNKKAYATCSYAIDWFENHPEFDDLYLEDKK